MHPESALEEPNRCRSLPRPLRSKLLYATPNSRLTEAAMPQTGMVGVQPSLGRPDCVGRRAAGFCQPLSRLRWARFWPLTFAGLSIFILLARRPGKLAPGSTSLLGQLFRSRRVAASRRRLAHPVLCCVRMRRAGRQITRPMGRPDFSWDVCPGSGRPAHP